MGYCDHCPKCGYFFDLGSYSRCENCHAVNREYDGEPGDLHDLYDPKRFVTEE